MKLKEIRISESPYLNDDELGYQVLAKISSDALKRSYTHLVKAKDIDIFAGTDTGFIAGLLTKKGLSTVVMITCRVVAYPTEPSGLANYQQVSMVNTSKEFADKGRAKLVYTEIAKKVDLVSDHEQYLGAKGLWKSLARESDVNVYVFDGRTKDYIRDEDGTIKRYNGNNLQDSAIWGNTMDHKLVLLVATAKKF